MDISGLARYTFWIVLFWIAILGVVGVMIGHSISHSEQVATDCWHEEYIGVIDE